MWYSIHSFHSHFFFFHAYGPPRSSRSYRSPSHVRRLRHLWRVCGASITLGLNFKCKDLGLQKPPNVVFINKCGKNSSRHMYGSVRWYSMRSHHVKWLPDTFKSARACYFEFHALLFKDSLFRDLIWILIQGRASFPYFFFFLHCLCYL